MASSTQGKSSLRTIIAMAGLVYIVALVAFSWGFFSNKLKLFPYHTVQDILDTFGSLEAQEELRQNVRSAHEILYPGADNGVTVNSLPAGTDDLIFITWFRDGQFIAELIDRQGKSVHRWQIPHDQLDMSKALDRDVWLEKRNQTIHGAHLSPNGDVLLVNEYRGIVKLNKDSELLWRTKNPNHHAVTVGPDGSIWSLSLNQVTDPADFVAGARKPYMDHTVVRYSPDGELLDEFSVPKLITDNRYGGILYYGPEFAPAITPGDPTHLNDIDVLSARQASYFPRAVAGDLMLSLRTINTLIIVHPQTRQIVWSKTGPFLRQHDPLVTDDGLLLVYDNRTDQSQLGDNVRYLREPQRFGYSRILALRPATGEIAWEYRGSPEAPFYSSVQGKLQQLANGDVLAVEPEGGRIFEVEPATGNIVWEYRNRLDADFVGRVTQAVRFSRDELQFLDQGQGSAATADTSTSAAR